jgi:hypothetical protein
MDPRLLRHGSPGYRRESHIATEDRQPNAAVPVACRVWERHPCDLQAACQAVVARGAGDSLWSATVRNISCGGVGLVLDRRFEPGTGLTIEIPQTTSSRDTTLFVRVVHVRDLTEGKWLVGCAFLSELSMDEIADLLRLARAGQGSKNYQAVPTLARLSLSSVQDTKPGALRLRTAQQSHVIPDVSLWWAGDELETDFLLVRRLILRGQWPLPQGAALKGRAMSSAIGIADVHLKVHGCFQEAGRWIVAYTFVELPSATILDAFGIPRNLALATQEKPQSNISAGWSSAN